jgi:hypothetical protein
MGHNTFYPAAQWIACIFTQNKVVVFVLFKAPNRLTTFVYMPQPATTMSTDMVVNATKVQEFYTMVSCVVTKSTNKDHRWWFSDLKKFSK